MSEIGPMPPSLKPLRVAGRVKSAAMIGMIAMLSSAVLSGPALAGPPFRTDDAEAVEYQHWEIDVFSLGTSIRGGTVGILPGVEVNYGVVPNVQLHVTFPVGYNSTLGKGTGFGLGDTELGVKYRFIDAEKDDWWPQVAVFPLVEIPTGNQHLGLSTGHTQVFLPMWLQKEFGAWTTYGGGGYWVNPGAGNKDSWFAGWALWRKVTEDFNLGVEIFHQTATAAGGKAGTGFNVGATYDLSENFHLLVSAGSGIQNPSATNQFSYYMGLQLTF